MTKLQEKAWCATVSYTHLLFLQFLDVGGSACFIEITDGFVGYILSFLENGSCLLISIAENFVFSLVDF